MRLVFRRAAFSAAIATVAILTAPLAGLPAHAQVTEMLTMPAVNAATTRVLVLPAVGSTVGGANVSADSVAAVYDEMRSQFTKRGFQVIEGGAAAGIDFSEASNRTMQNFVQAGQQANADFVGLIYVDKVKTVAPYETFRQPFVWYEFFPRRAYIGPSWVARSLLGALLPFVSGLTVAPGSKFGSTIYTYLIDVKNNQPVLLGHRNYGNSETVMWGRSKSKHGARGAAQDAAMFIMSRTLKDYKPTN